MSSCKCSQHEAFTKGQDSKILKLDARKVKVATHMFMKESGLLSKHANTVCQLCIAYVESTLMNKKRKLDNAPCSTTSFSEQNYDSFFHQLTCMNGAMLKKVAKTLGDRVCDQIYDDTQTIKGTYKDIGTLTDFNLQSWLNDRNEILTSFLLACAGCSDQKNVKKTMCIAGAVDSIYKARSLNYIAPLPFSKNLLTYYLSGSKLIAQLNNRQEAAGSYSSLKRWLQDISVKPIKRAENVDLITFFDNSQTIARNWRVNYSYRTKASVITTTVHIQPKLLQPLQLSPHLSPVNWFYNKDISDCQMINLIEDKIKVEENTYNSLRNNYIEKRLQKVIGETVLTTDSVKDSIDDRLRGVYGPVKKETVDDPYDWVPSQHLQTSPTIKVGEPAMENPCSYASIKSVIKHIQKQNNVGNGRAWTIAGCDGLPYVLGNRLMENDGDLQNVLLLPGLGHIEINALKACFKLLWEPCFQELAKMLGFRTPRALMCCQLCSDHHKSWMIFTIFLLSTMDEILTTFVKYCRREQQNPTVNRLYQYIGDSKDKNFRFMCDAIFNVMLPLFMFRCGVRRNNPTYIDACLVKFMKMFYGFNMTYYQELMYYYLKTSVLAPPDFKTFLSQTMAFTSSGNSSKGEGGDFILEAINRKIKRWLPPGIPTNQQWLQICRNLDKLNKIRQSTSRSLGIRPETSNVYQRDITTEILEWRVKLRSSSYLSNTGIENMNHTSIDGQELDKQLLSFELQCSTNMHTYFQATGSGSKPGKQISLVPVFTTKLARTKFHAVENKTKAQISNMIVEGIADVRRNGDVDEAIVLDAQWQKIKVRTKNEMLQFYKEVTVALENSSVIDPDTDDETSDRDGSGQDDSFDDEDDDDHDDA